MTENRPETMAERVEQEWQPARIVRSGHGPNLIVPSPLTEQERLEAMKKIIRVCKCKPSEVLLESFRASGCDAEMFFRLHPHDLANRVSDTVIVQCEHGILTD